MMARPRPLLEIDIRHGFYADGACPDLRLAPTAATRTLIARAGGAVRATPRGLELWLDDAAIADWRRAAEDDDLVWLARFDDAGAADATCDLGRVSRELSCFDAADAVLDAPTGYWRLHRQDTASAADMHAVDIPRPDVRPVMARCGKVSLELAELHGSARMLVRIPVRAAASPADGCARYLIRTAPRGTLWKYCLVGDWREPALQVVDLAGLVSFEPAPPHELADGRRALAFRSSEPIALQQRSRERFQLRSQAVDARDDARARPERIIVRRLPVAAPQHLSREVIDGVPALVSEIFVHR